MLVDRIEKVKERQAHYINEASVLHSIVGPILESIGWDTTDPQQFCPEYMLETGRVDICLIHNRPAVFIEAKEPEKDLHNHEQQLLKYAFSESVKLAVLTNGFEWWFYLPMLDNSTWSDRKFITLDLREQDASHIAECLEMYLSWDNIINGSAVNNAYNIHNSGKRDVAIQNALMPSWEDLRNGDERLLDLLADKVEAKCGYRPDLEIVEKFLANQNHAEPERQKPYTGEADITESPMHKSPSRYELFGYSYNVQTWKDILIGVCVILSKNRDFGKVLKLRGIKRPYFSDDPSKLRSPTRIGNTDIYVETNSSAKRKLDMCYKLLELFGHNSDSLRVFGVGNRNT